MTFPELLRIGLYGSDATTDIEAIVHVDPAEGDGFYNEHHPLRVIAVMVGKTDILPLLDYSFIARLRGIALDHITTGEIA